MKAAFCCGLLLAWAPLSQASLNAARPDAALTDRLATSCGTRAAERADWGNITALVQSVRLCRQNGGEALQSERLPVRADAGLAQRASSLLPDLTQAK